MTVARRKPALRTKSATRYATTTLARRGGELEVLHAAHRAQLASAIADLTAKQLRSVAQVMGLALDISKRKSDTPAQALKAIVAADEALLRQIEALEQFADAPEIGPVSLADVAAQGTALAARRSKDVTLKLDVARELPPVAASSADLVEAIFAVVNNGCEAAAARPNGNVRITAAVRQTMVLLIVHDNGPGLSPGMKRRLFDPLVTTRRHGDHLGIGLAVARQLARRNGGDLRHEATPTGARFVLSLPRWDALRPAVRRASR